MIRIVGYLVPDASMPQAKRSAWFTIWESAPNLSSSRALKHAAARFVTWERRLATGSHNGVTRVALEVMGSNVVTQETEDRELTVIVRVLDVSAPTVAT